MPDGRIKCLSDAWGGEAFPHIERWQSAVRARLDTIVSALLLPLFLALTGMRTRLDLLSGKRIWMWTGVVLAAAIHEGGVTTGLNR